MKEQYCVECGTVVHGRKCKCGVECPPCNGCKVTPCDWESHKGCSRMRIGGAK